MLEHGTAALVCTELAPDWVRAVTKQAPHNGTEPLSLRCSKPRKLTCRPRPADDRFDQVLGKAEQTTHLGHLGRRTPSCRLVCSRARRANRYHVGRMPITEFPNIVHVLVWVRIRSSAAQGAFHRAPLTCIHVSYLGITTPVREGPLRHSPIATPARGQPVRYCLAPWHHLKASLIAYLSVKVQAIPTREDDHPCMVRTKFVPCTIP